MVMVNNILLHTGRGNPSPVYDPELLRFNGLKRRDPTLTRGVPRGRPLTHPAHTPAMPLVGRKVPTFQCWQVTCFPQIIAFDISVAALTTEFHTSPRIATPSTLTRMTFYVPITAVDMQVQVAFTNEIVTTDAAFAAHPLIFKVAPENLTWANPIAQTVAIGLPFLWEWPLNHPLPTGPRNRIVVRVQNTDPTNVATARLQFHIQPD